jgi:hypothetical protein
MNRRTFLEFSVLAGTTLTAPLLHSKFLDLFTCRPAPYPRVLSHICSDDILTQIGTSYRNLFPEENSTEQLLTLLFRGRSVREVPFLHSALIGDQLDQQVQNDFRDENTIIINGWFLSRTEARQCALLSLN